MEMHNMGTGLEFDSYKFVEMLFPPRDSLFLMFIPNGMVVTPIFFHHVSHNMMQGAGGI